MDSPAHRPNPVHDDNPHFEVPQQGGSSCLSNEFLGTTLDLSAFCVGGSQTSQGPQTSHATYQTSQGSQQSPSQRGGQPQCPRNEYCYPTPPQSEVIQAQDYRHGGIQTPPAHARKLQREDAPRVQEQQQRQQKQCQQQEQQQQQQEQQHHTSTDPRVEEDESVAGSREQCAGLSSTQLIGLITCVACSRVFNRVAVCQGYLLQLNRPVQCLCGCVICTLCYRTHRGCLKHSVSSAHGPVNATARYLAECPQLESVGTWDLGRDEADRFKTGKESLPEEDAHRYVCIPHVPGFWDHVLVGNIPPPPTGAEAVTGLDIYLPRLFDVDMGSHAFHWCCFVLRKQIILAMWCTTVLAAREHRETAMVPLIDSSLRGKETDVAFRRMLHYLREWFVVRYRRKPEGVDDGRELHVVLDCKPPDGPTLIHLISKLKAKSGMRASARPKVRPLRKRPFGVDANNNAAAKLFDYTSRGETEEAHNYINITEEYNDHHRLTERASGQLTQYICTNRDYYGIYGPIRLSERKDSSALVPYGSYTYDSAKSYLPGGLFHFVKDVDTYVPTLHGLGQDFISRLKEVAVCEATSSMVDRPFLNAPHLYEVELINTGHESLRQGDRFTVQLPNRQDVDAHCKAEGDPGYEATVNRGIWGGLLATRRVNCEYGGDPVEEAIQAIKREPDFDVFRLISPYEPQSVLSMMSLIANGADHHLVPEGTRRMAANAVNGAFDANAVALVVQDEQAKRFLRTVIGHAMTIVESLQGFAGGQVIRACSGYNTSRIRTGERLMAQLNVNRWLL
ncbi:hypothetical protein Q5P01_000550 [Channa striata]|uniref:Uncharacterized protein n=1 Tax=Channa striata TaxID=64152 RepID=A0AA88LF14_CHASR|nr:hypothetical protein Q5P01_000550 [Channa striata]